mmetsp:Transcript_36503/g.81268  ORF Transcript_36503/g.81268 Transcript_36503/m.81268 type:complete len:278 (+) Transcript_36503:191-1024(+)|eukprot:CAMPEP_0202891804 /NCGR_PEP_ID=MMETSP1392-20130828/1770_1 /ASSEMBLY_ACC=CAM_ASM_000868 /TAXON_ID=225041 /ORGANISM="Chlamydomonas chlamydogama, Strain SAG 11-48b" /LENGTH=277 /DNA_ID=CAMNT_0049575663 /DNA_START=194 /DNA_END=1027 /DNA_ORIENTATION=+
MAGVPDDLDEYDFGNEELISMCMKEIGSEGFDCASVDLLLQMGRDGEIDTVADVLGNLAGKGRPDWAAEISKMFMGVSGTRSSEPDYAVVASVLTYLVDQGHTDWAHIICRHLLVMQKQGSADCYDLAFVLGHMVKQRRAEQGGKILYAIYSDETPEGHCYHTLVPVILGTLIDYQHMDWALELSKQLCYVDGDKEIDYSVLGWCMTQHVEMARPDWAGQLCQTLKSAGLKWYNEAQMLGSVEQWSHPGLVQAIRECMVQQPGAKAAAPGGPNGGPK